MKEWESPRGLKISDEKLNSFTIKVLKLTDKEIDSLYFSCGYVVVDHEKELKSLRNFDLQQIRSNFNVAKRKIFDLIDETSLSKFEYSLDNIEKAR